MPSPFSPAVSGPEASPEVVPFEDSDGCSRLYGPNFWYTYAASTLVTVASSILFRYADLVTILGGTELQLGWIVGLGMVGSVLARFSLGNAIDRYGPKRLWLASLVVLAATCFAHLPLFRCDGFEIYLLRLIYCTSIAGIFGASTTFVSSGVSSTKMAELLGILGTSGFAGMMLGTQLGDWMAGSRTTERWVVDRIFVAAGLFAAAAIPFAWLATRQVKPPSVRRDHATWMVLRDYQPGFVLAVGAAAGAALSLPQAFLRTYAETIHIPRTGVFFAAVAVTAVVTRILNRRVLERIGLTIMIFVGLGLLALAQILYLVVDAQWKFIFPGLPYGIGQAILYPVVAAVGTTTFPKQYRGMGIILVLAAFDVGQLIAGPLAGGLIHVSGRFGVPAYPALFLATAAMLVAIAAIYWWTLRRRKAESALSCLMILRFPLPLRGGTPVVIPAKVATDPPIYKELNRRPPVGSSRSIAATRR